MVLRCLWPTGGFVGAVVLQTSVLALWRISSRVHRRESGCGRSAFTLWYLADQVARTMVLCITYWYLLLCKCGKQRLTLHLHRSDFILDFPRPLVPNVIMVGGINCNVKNPLPQVRPVDFRVQINLWAIWFLLTPSSLNSTYYKRWTEEESLMQSSHMSFCFGRIWSPGCQENMGL